MAEFLREGDGMRLVPGRTGRVPSGVNGERSRGSSSIRERSTNQKPGTFWSNTGARKRSAADNPTVRHAERPRGTRC